MPTARRRATKTKATSTQTRAKTTGQKTSTLHVVSLDDKPEQSPFQTIDISQIDSGDDRSIAVDLSNLISSIEDIGLLNPITVTQHGKSRFHLLSGCHRLEACKELGWTSIPAHILHLDELHAELATIDENLVRPHQLSDLEFAEQLQRRKVIYETLHPEVRWGGNRHEDPNFGSQSERNPAFIDNSATITGRSRSTVGEYLQIAKNLAPEVKDALRDTPIADRKMDLLKVAKMEPEDQTTIANTVIDYKFPNITNAIQKVRETINPEFGRKRDKKKSLYDGVGMMGFLEEVRDFAYKEMDQYEERDILSHEFDTKDGEVILVLTLRDVS